MEDYVRPQFEVVMRDNDSALQLGKPVHIRGDAKTYYGVGLSNAQVRCKITRVSYYPDDNRYGQGSDAYPHNLVKKLSTGECMTDASGAFDISFVPQPDPWFTPLYDPAFEYVIEISVTGPSGETIELSASRKLDFLGPKPSIDFPEQVFKDEINSLSILGKDLNGMAVPCKGHFTITRLDTADAETAVSDGSFDTGISAEIPLGDMKNWPSGRYRIALKTISDYGKGYSVQQDFELFGRADREIPSKADFWVMEEKSVAKLGDTASFWVGTQAEKVYLWMEWESRNKIIHQEWLQIKKGVQRVQIPISDAHQGGIVVRLGGCKDATIFYQAINIAVPWTRKELKISYGTFRDHLQPGVPEEWTVTVSGNGKDAVAAEMVTCMFDASLDALVPNNWPFLSRFVQRDRDEWERIDFLKAVEHNQFIYDDDYSYDLDKGWRGGRWYRHSKNQISYRSERRGTQKHSSGGLSANAKGKRRPKVYYNLPPRRGTRTLYINEIGGDQELGDVFSEIQAGKLSPFKPDSTRRPAEAAVTQSPQVRKNLQETAFFFPSLRTDAQGNLQLKFTSPEALTRWRMLAFAHTPDFKTGYREDFFTTQKNLMIVGSPLRFFREGDRVVYAATVSNMSDHNLTGNATLELLDAETQQPIDQQFGNQDGPRTFELAPGRSTVLNWEFHIPPGTQTVIHRVRATAENFSDGEERLAPVLPREQLVQQSMTMQLQGGETRSFAFDPLLQSAGKNLKHQQLVLEYSSNPAWYAVQALPYLMEFPYECAEQTFSRFYANALAEHILESNPRLQQVIAQWQSVDTTALQSDLEKNPELKSLLLQETPWVLDARSETERKQHLAALLDPKRLKAERIDLKDKLIRLEEYGRFSWFPGMQTNRYISQKILCGLGHLDHLGLKIVREDQSLWRLVIRGMNRLESDLAGTYNSAMQDTLAEETCHISALEIQALYARSFFPDRHWEPSNKKAHEYFLRQAQRFWSRFNPGLQAMLALTLHRDGEPKAAAAIVAALKASSVRNPQQGMFWSATGRGDTWQDAPIETQALLIELWSETTQDAASIAEMQRWLILQKQTQQWGNTKATADACYALLLRGQDWLSEDAVPSVRVGGEQIELEGDAALHREAGTGYFQKIWKGEEVQARMGNVEITNPNAGIAYGAMYWQYLQNIDAMVPTQEGLYVRREIFVEESVGVDQRLRPILAQTPLKMGEKVVVRISIDNERDMEFVQLQDQRQGCFEPISQLSGYHHADGLGYYESPRDASTNFFVDALPRGHHVLSYAMRVAHAGTFTGGLTRVQSMYAPAYSAQCVGGTVSVLR